MQTHTISRRSAVTTLLAIPAAVFGGSAAADPAAGGRTVNVAGADALRAAVRDASPGTRIVLAPGRYRPGVHAAGLRGTAAAPIVLEGANPKDKPLFEGGQTGLHFGGCAHVTLRNLAVRGAAGNGINIDDGGKPDSPAHHITLDGVDVSDVGPTGNRDGIKLSGVDDLILRNCTVEGWGGEGVDLVGCHRVLIEGCILRGKPGFSQAVGVQAKGGSADVVVRRCTFLAAGQRGVNLGGSTGMAYFRPRGANYEAKDVTVEGCRFVGGLVPVAFVGCDGGVVRYNTFVRPDKWVLRILQETREAGFVPCRNGRFERNLIVYRRDRVRDPANVGPQTDAATFTFRDNWWFCEDRPTASRPGLPAPEQGGVYGVDPGVTAPDRGAPSAPTQGAAKGYGADALPR